MDVDDREGNVAGSSGDHRQRRRAVVDCGVADD
jgi:hypothetical protein